jgi:hypothetical protein
LRRDREASGRALRGVVARAERHGGRERGRGRERLGSRGLGRLGRSGGTETTREDVRGGEAERERVRSEGLHALGQELPRGRRAHGRRHLVRRGGIEVEVGEPGHRVERLLGLDRLLGEEERLARLDAAHGDERLGDEARLLPREPSLEGGAVAQELHDLGRDLRRDEAPRLAARADRLDVEIVGDVDRPPLGHVVEASLGDRRGHDLGVAPYVERGGRTSHRRLVPGGRERRGRSNGDHRRRRDLARAQEGRGVDRAGGRLEARTGTFHDEAANVGARELLRQRRVLVVFEEPRVRRLSWVAWGLPRHDHDGSVVRGQRANSIAKTVDYSSMGDPAFSPEGRSSPRTWSVGFSRFTGER